jgi:hypothetical protein
MTRLSREETIVEIEWLLDAGLSPLYISNVLGRSVEALRKLAERSGNRRIYAAFGHETAVYRYKREKVRDESR